jgi:hypothetical protein
MGEGLATVNEEFSQCRTRGSGPHEGQHGGRLDVESEGFQSADLVGDHGLGEDSDAEPADREVCHGPWSAGL